MKAVKNIFDESKNHNKNNFEVITESNVNYNSLINNLYSFPNNKMLSNVNITAIYCDWVDSTHKSNNMEKKNLGKYYRVWYRGLSSICYQYKKVKFIDIAGDGIFLIIIGNEKNTAIEIIKKIEEYRGLMNDEYNELKLEIRSGYESGQVSILKAGRASKNSKQFQNLIFIGNLICNLVKKVESN